MTKQQDNELCDNCATNAKCIYWFLMMEDNDYLDDGEL